MSFQLNMPPSLMTKMAKEAGDEEEEGEEDQGKRTREDYKKLKELEEMRKAGTAPAMKDEEGKDINPHIPQYIMQAPWYYAATQATLRHQRIQPEDVQEFNQMNDWYKRGVKEGPIATKFRKGACDNCGAMTHKKKDCLERPRKVTAKYSGSNFAPDEYINTHLDFDYDGKRDRWNGYDTMEHSKVIDEYQKIDEAKKLLKAAKFDGDVDQAEDEKDEDSDKDEDKYADDVDMPGQKFETKQRITVRNLRIREDTAKYLYNLNVDSAHYDPKTRSMRDNPFEGPGATENKTHMPYIGDNFVRYSGGAMNMAKQQLFAWEAYEKGSDVHLQADPTKLELLNKEYKKRKEDFTSNRKESILDKYGGQEHMDALPKQLLMAQSENYVEYSRHGTVIKGEEKAKVKSQYNEDVYINNHTAVWGSYWKEGRWGFKCCHSCIRESYCTGESGKDAHDTQLPAIESASTPSFAVGSSSASSSGAMATSLSNMAATAASSSAIADDKSHPESDSGEQQLQMALGTLHEEKLKAEKRKKKKKKKKKKRKKDKKKKKKQKSSSSESDSSESEDEDEATERKIKEAMKTETKRVEEVNCLLQMDERKRPYNSMFDVVEPTDEEMEAFRRKRLREDDPMAQFMS